MQLRQVTHKAIALGIGVGLLTAGAVAAATDAAASRAAATSTVTMHRFDDRLLERINAARANHGLPPVVLAAGTTDVAHGWACHLAAERALAHNGALLRDLESHGSRLLSSYAENVGSAPTDVTAGWLFRSYMHSPEHRANILDPAARYVGIWTKDSGQFRFNTIDFVGKRAASYDSSYGAMRTTC